MLLTNYSKKLGEDQIPEWMVEHPKTRQDIMGIGRFILCMLMFIFGFYLGAGSAWLYLVWLFIGLHYLFARAFDSKCEMYDFNTAFDGAFAKRKTQTTGATA